MSVFGNAFALALTALISQQICLAQVDLWERVRLIEPGKKVAIKLHSGSTVSGKMEAWNPQGLSVRQGKQKVSTVEKSDVAQVALVTGMSRARKAMYAGLIAGGVTGALMGAACSSSCYPSPVVVPIGAAFIGGTAAGIAALFPPHKEVIYTAPSLAARTVPEFP